MFQVVDRTGAVHGPVPVETLRNWASEGRLTPDMTVIDQQTGQQGPAGQLLAGTPVFANMPAGAAPQPQAPPQPQPQPVAQPQSQAYAQPQQPQQGFIQAQIPQGNFAQPAQQFGFQGSAAPGSIPKLGPRASAFLVDLVIGAGIIGLVETWLSLGMWDFVQRGFNLGWTAYLRYVTLPLVIAFFLIKDVLFPGQSIGKRIARLKVIGPSGANCTIVQSVIRNLGVAPLLLAPIPYAGGFVIFPIVFLFAIADAFMVMTTGKRILDGVAKTLVVNE